MGMAYQEMIWKNLYTVDNKKLNFFDHDKHMQTFKSKPQGSAFARPNIHLEPLADGSTTLAKGQALENGVFV